MHQLFQDIFRRSN